MKVSVLLILIYLNKYFDFLISWYLKFMNMMKYNLKYYINLINVMSFKGFLMYIDLDNYF